jgi:cell division protein FtsL
LRFFLLATIVQQEIQKLRTEVSAATEKEAELKESITKAKSERGLLTD